MASPQYSTAELIANIKRRCAVPTSQLTYTDEDFALLANDELQGEVVPLIMAAREEYFVDFIDISVTGSEIDIPDYVIGQKLRTVALVSPGSPLSLINLARIDLDVVAGVGFSNVWTLAGFYVQGNKLILYPQNAVPQNTTIRLYYYKRTLVLAPPSDFGQVKTIDALSNTVTLTYLPFTWATGTVLNTVSSLSPFSTTNTQLTVVATSSPSLILDTVEGIQVGDYISEQGYSAIPQVLVEAHALLAQLTAVKCLEGLGATSGMQAAMQQAQKLEKNMMVMISQRVDGSVKKIVNPNGGLRLSSGIWRNGYNRNY